jgi:cytochrome o ubiquinol oxidase subunit IV
MNLRSYIVGFLSSLALTSIAFFLVWKHAVSGHTMFSHELLAVLVVLLALIQLCVQVVYFLHIKESKSWNRSVFALTVMIVVFVVLGSLWIMSNLKEGHAVPFDGQPSAQTEH